MTKQNESESIIIEKKYSNEMFLISKMNEDINYLFRYFYIDKQILIQNNFIKKLFVNFVIMMNMMFNHS